MTPPKTSLSIPKRDELRRLFDLIVELPDYAWDDLKDQLVELTRKRSLESAYQAEQIEELIGLIVGRRRHVARMRALRAEDAQYEGQR